MLLVALELLVLSRRGRRTLLVALELWALSRRGRRMLLVALELWVFIVLSGRRVTDGCSF
jgi:hypothetical protein